MILQGFKVKSTPVYLFDACHCRDDTTAADSPPIDIELCKKSERVAGNKTVFDIIFILSGHRLDNPPRRRTIPTLYPMSQLWPIFNASVPKEGASLCAIGFPPS